MSSGMLVCETCRKNKEDFVVPNDEIGAASMKQHLTDKHNVLFSYKTYQSEDDYGE